MSIEIFRVILKELESQKAISGNVLSRKLGISRVAVRKRIERLRNLGYKIHTSRNGYTLIEKPDIPYPWEINGWKVIWLDEVESTQDVARKMEAGTCVIAGKQTKGRGRLSRIWESPYGNIYMSIVLKPKVEMREVPKISLISAVAILRTLESLGIEGKVKWPNDIWVEGRKIAGILCEAEGETDRIDRLIVGIGLNVKVKPLKIAASICEFRDVKIVDVVKLLLEEFKKVLKEKWIRLKGEIESKLLFMGEEVVVLKAGNRKIRGRIRGISTDGSLILEQSSEVLEYVWSGDVIKVK